MKTTAHIFTFLSFVLLLNSCAFHSGVMTGNAALSDANFKVVDYAIGTSETFKVFGLGGVATDALVLEAKRNLYENHPLKEGQALANVSVDSKNSYFIIVSKKKILISADIIDFNDDAVSILESEHFPMGVENKRDNDLAISSEKVYFEYQGKLKFGKVVGYGQTRVKVLVHNSNNRLRIKRIPVKKLFFVNKKEGLVESKFKINDKITYLEEVLDENDRYVDVQRFGKIVGFGQKEAIVEYEVEGISMIFMVEYEKLSLRE